MSARPPDLTEVVRQLETPEADLPVIASTLQKEVDDLFPIAETLQMLRFADMGGGDLCLIEAGRSFAECTVRMIGWSRGATIFQIASFEVWPRTLFSLARP
jgi:hypothetical protein